MTTRSTQDRQQVPDKKNNTRNKTTKKNIRQGKGVGYEGRRGIKNKKQTITITIKSNTKQQTIQTSSIIIHKQ